MPRRMICDEASENHAELGQLPAFDRDIVALQKRAQGCIGVKLGGQASGLKPLGPARIEIIIDRA